MASTYEDTVFDFDLNFLHQTSNISVVPGRIDKQRKAIFIAKKKTVATDSLIKKYYAKKEILDQTEKTLFDSKEECKQICIEYKILLEKCTKLEKDAQILQNTNKELEAKCISSENRCEAIQSHANQLQSLVKEHETLIEALKIENQLEKTNIKDYEKKISFLQKENEKITKQHSLLLQKYEKSNDDKSDGYKSGEEHDCNESDILYNSPMSPLYTEDLLENDVTKAQQSTVRILDKESNIKKYDKTILKKVDVDHDSDFSNEVVSEDTGRGSSVAFSDGDKCFNSPDYFNDDSPMSIEIIRDKEKRKQTDAATSPITVNAHIATSPIIFDDNALLTQFKDMRCNNLTINSLGNDNNHSTVNMIDRAVSPVQSNINTGSPSPLEKASKDITTSPVKFDSTITVSSGQLEGGKVLQEKECLETYNSNNLSDSGDCEVQMILNVMRLNHNIISPIPTTPAKSHDTEVGCRSHALTEQAGHGTGYVCQEAEKIREDNKILHASIADLAKEVLNIKSLLKNQLLTKESNESNVNKDHLINHEPPSQASRKEILCMFEKNSTLSTLVQFEDPMLSSIQSEESFSKDTIQLDSGNVVDDNSPILNSKYVSEVTTIGCNDNIGEKSVIKNEKVFKARKLSRLEKFRKKMLPKSKIKRAIAPPGRKMLIRSIQPRHCKAKSLSLNNKEVYQKALKVMAELKDQQKGVVANVVIKKPKKNKTSESKLVVKANETQNNAKEIDQICEAHNTGSVQSSDITQNSFIRTRSRSKCFQQDQYGATMDFDIHNEEDENVESNTNCVNNLPQEKRKAVKRASVDKVETQKKRILRSSTIQQLGAANHSVIDTVISKNDVESVVKIDNLNKTSENIDTDKSMTVYTLPENQNVSDKEVHGKKITDYSDLGLFSETIAPLHKQKYKEDDSTAKVHDPKESILCTMLEKYGTSSVKISAKKVSDSVTNSICKNIEESIEQIIELPPNETRNAMNKFVEEIQRWKIKHFMSGLMKYLKDPARKTELFNKVSSPPAPPMTKSEQVLLYVVTQLKIYWPSLDIVNNILSNIEFSLFKLNRTPEFNTIESMSHFYAVLCRYSRAKSRLRLFILDAMYCIQFKAVPLIRQCLDVWMHVLPLAHLGIAKSPVVTCLVYLLHFYKCEDRFNRVQDIRNILSRKYSYQITEWNETKILEMFKNSIKELRDIPVERKMLRMALIILAKRQGPRWCQNNIVKNMLQPMIEKENVPERIKQFCVSILGPLLKPYPADMKVHCEIVMNQLLDLLNQKPSQKMEEAIFTSLIYISRHNQNRVIQALLSWKPEHNISSEFEELLRDYVKEKPLKIWKSLLSKILLA